MAAQDPRAHSNFSGSTVPPQNLKKKKMPFAAGVASDAPNVKLASLAYLKDIPPTHHPPHPGKYYPPCWETGLSSLEGHVAARR